jgi:hypothetical protein
MEVVIVRIALKNPVAVQGTRNEAKNNITGRNMSRDDLPPALGRPARAVGSIAPVDLGAEKMGPVGDVKAIIYGKLVDESCSASTAKQNGHPLSNVLFIGQADVVMLLE